MTTSTFHENLQITGIEDVSRFPGELSRQLGSVEAVRGPTLTPYVALRSRFVSGNDNSE